MFMQNRSPQQQLVLKQALLEFMHEIQRLYGIRIEQPVYSCSDAAVLHDQDKILLSTKDAARILGFAIKTLENWRAQGRGPSFIKIGGRVFYHRTSLDRWVKASNVTNKKFTGADYE